MGHGCGLEGFHVRMQGLKDLSTLCYAWRAGGDLAWEDGDRFYPGDGLPLTGSAGAPKAG